MINLKWIFKQFRAAINITAGNRHKFIVFVAARENRRRQYTAARRIGEHDIPFVTGPAVILAARAVAGLAVAGGLGIGARVRLPTPDALLASPLQAPARLPSSRSQNSGKPGLPHWASRPCSGAPPSRFRRSAKS